MSKSDMSLYKKLQSLREQDPQLYREIMADMQRFIEKNMEEDKITGRKSRYSSNNTLPFVINNTKQ